MSEKNPTGILRQSHPAVVAASKVFIVLALGTLLYFGRSAFVPIALALLLWLILSGPVEALHRRRVPRSLSALIILVLTLSMLGAAIMVMWNPVEGWIAKAPQTIAAIKQKIGPVAKALDRIETMRKSATFEPGKPVAQPPPAAVPPVATAPGLIANATTTALTALLAFIIVTLFLLIGGPPMLARMTAAFADNLNTTHVIRLIQKVRVEVGQFYLATTLINVGLGVLTGLAMWVWGMPTPYLWGLLAAVVNYIPYAGAATTLAVISLVAMVSFNTLGQVLGVVATQLAIATLEGQVVQPLLIGRRLDVNPLLIFLGLWFGGFMWGIAGIMLATPALVTLKVIAEHSNNARAMMEFLGPIDQAQPALDVQIRKFARRITD